ncbi:protein serine threonine phosphatase 2C [Mycena sanguinolenta]|nr:protein serine threonine phosphatase 2C [Mycena sanguinolenta]
MDDLYSHLSEASSSNVVHGAHVLTFQPGSDPNEDRYLVEEWLLHNGTWKILAVFDGHGAGTEAADFVLATLSGLIKDTLSALTHEEFSAANIDELLARCIRDVDMRIHDDFVALFPGDVSDLSPEEICQAIRDPDSKDGHSRVEVLRARTGTTAIVALIDPKNSIHVASLGDCDAVLGTKNEEGWQSTILSARHNCANANEVARIKSEHPTEPECVNSETSRTLGLIAVTRAMGDMLFKLPAVYTERVAPLSLPPIHPNYDLKGLAMRNITPPYLSNTAEVAHLSLPQSDAPRLLIIASDGLINILSRTKDIRLLSEAAPLWFSAAVGDTRNMAVNVLWDTLQCLDGENMYKRMLEGQKGRRVDDITIIVCPI